MSIPEIIFKPADILIPKLEPMEKWPVIACDQFTSQSDYWNNVRDMIGNFPSTMNMIFPETYLGDKNEQRVHEIHEYMKRYLQEGIFEEYKNSFIYVERTLENKKIRKGIVGVIDLEAYDCTAYTHSLIRPTEETVSSRIPPRRHSREAVPLELSHVLLMCDDRENKIFESLNYQKAQMKKLYDFDLMLGGGHIAGWLINDKVALELLDRIDVYSEDIREHYKSVSIDPVIFLVGDGNHSLAAAKACYEDLKIQLPPKEALKHPARYAMVELVNLQDEAISIEGIHRIVTEVDVQELLHDLKNHIGGDGSRAIEWNSGENCGIIHLKDSDHRLPLEILQEYLDDYIRTNGGKIDYIHGKDAVQQLSQQRNSIGFTMDSITKNDLMEYVALRGTFPRKTFSIGHAKEKRYYLEARRL